MMSKLRSRASALLQALCLALVVIGAFTAVSAARLPYDAHQKQRQLERAYMQGVASGTIVRPFRDSQIAVAGKLVYPRLGQSLVIVDTDSIEALDAGPALLAGTAPIGQPGTSVLSAHNDLHFEFLRRARVGDEIEAAGPDGRMRSYRVTRTEIVDRDSFSVPMGTAGNALALYTCYPFNAARTGDRRFVVHAELSD